MSKVVVGKNGDLGVVFPLYTIAESDDLGKMDGLRVAFFKDYPVAYALDLGLGKLNLLNADIVESNLEFLSDL